MTTLFGAIKMLFGNKGLYYRAYVGGVVKIFDCPRSTLPYIDNHMVDFNIINLNDGIALVYLRGVNLYVVLIGITCTDSLVILDMAMNVLKDYNNNPLLRRTLLL